MESEKSYVCNNKNWHTRTEWFKPTLPDTNHTDVMYPLIWFTLKDILPLCYSPKSITPGLFWENIRQTLIKGILQNSLPGFFISVEVIKKKRKDWEIVTDWNRDDDKVQCVILDLILNKTLTLVGKLLKFKQNLLIC